MNILEAKNEIKKTVEIYLMKNDQGEYEIPYMKQRPLYMMGAPGIGKTAIVEQVAAEMGVALVAYSMTHHTRQSAVGLPIIEETTYGGINYTVSQYTTSEIIASVLDVIEKSGKKEGILFLDEINCVSETLAPAMLLFLQYKKFGNCLLPEGWVIITAGNPPQYNKSVKDFDTATKDRMKIINIDEDIKVWKTYASENGVHPSIRAFLESKPEFFYDIRATVEGAEYVTARGWEDLSMAIKAYEQKGYSVNETLIRQYITYKDCSRKFAVFYDLFVKYRESYDVESILSGVVKDDLMEKAKTAKFDERISLLELMEERLKIEVRKVMDEDEVLLQIVSELRRIKHSKAICMDLGRIISEKNEQIEKSKMANSLTSDKKRLNNEFIKKITGYISTIEKNTDDDKSFEILKSEFKKDSKRHEKKLTQVAGCMENVISFIEKVWGEGNELVFFLTEIMASGKCIEFLSFGECPSYQRHNSKLLIYNENEKLKAEIRKAVSDLD